MTWLVGDGALGSPRGDARISDRNTQGGGSSLSEDRRWDDPDLGAVQGAGNERGAGRADIKKELEPGLAVVRFACDNSRVDLDWSQRDGRGFTWWGHRLPQRIWAEPPIEDAGIAITRVLASTDVVRGIADLAQAAAVVDKVNSLVLTSALVVDEGERTIRAIASAWVHGQSVEWAAPLFSIVAATQVAAAEQQADVLAALAGGEVAVSEHPVSGARPDADEMCGLLGLLEADGQGGSRWAGGDMKAALEVVRSMPGVTLATGDAAGITAEVVHGPRTSLVQLTTHERHPTYGSGMLVRVSLPVHLEDGPGWAAETNRREVATLVRSHFLGSWVGGSRFPSFVAFYPNFMAYSRVGVVNVAMSTVLRASWAANLRLR